MVGLLKILNQQEKIRLKAKLDVRKVGINTSVIIMKETTPLEDEARYNVMIALDNWVDVLGDLIYDGNHDAAKDSLRFVKDLILNAAKADENIIDHIIDKIEGHQQTMMLLV